MAGIFRSGEDVVRVVKGVRTAERNNSSEPEQVQQGALGSVPLSVSVKVTGDLIETDDLPSGLGESDGGLPESGYYPGRLVLNNVESTEPGDDWIEMPSPDGDVLVLSINEEVLEPDRRYIGRVIGHRNFKPVVEVDVSAGNGEDESYKTQCEYGFLRRYRLVGGEYVFDRDLGTPCIPKAGEPGHSTYPPETAAPWVGYLVTNVCEIRDESENLIGIRVERQRFTINAPVQVGPKICTDNPVNCCATGTAPEYEVVDCCPNADAVDTLGAEATGPLGETGSGCDVSWDLERTADDGGAVWVGTSAVGVDAPCVGVTVTAGVWCATGEDELPHWYASGSFTNFAGDEINWGPIVLEDDGIYLTGEVAVPDQEDPLVLSFERPCSPIIEGTVPTDCCPDNLLPETLHIVFIDGVSPCGCDLPATAAMEWTGNPLLGWYTNLTVTGACTTGGAQLVCDGTQWLLSYGAPGGCVITGVVYPLENCSGNVILSGTVDFSGTGGGAAVPFEIRRSAP